MLPPDVSLNEHDAESSPPAEDNRRSSLTSKVREAVPADDEDGLLHTPFWEVLERRDLLRCAASFAAAFQRVPWGERTGVCCLYIVGILNALRMSVRR